MSFALPCAGCGKALRIPADTAAAKFRCPACGAVTPRPADFRPPARRPRPPESVAEIDDDPEDAAAETDEIDEDPEDSAAEIDEAPPTASRAGRPPPAPKAAPKKRPTPPPVAVADRYDVFVSYCRDDGATIARLLADKVTAEGYRVFLDVEELGSGSWSRELELRINECPDFVVVLTAAYIDRLHSPGSVIQREVATALEGGRNVVPVLVEAMPPADQLPASVAALPDANGIRYVHEYTNAVVLKLCALLRSARLTGPERLRAGDPQPRAIVACLGMLLGALQGAQNGALAGMPSGAGVWGVFSAIVNGLVWTFAAFALLLPVALVLLGVASVAGIRRDRLYLGPWVPFWALFIPVVMIAASVLPVALFRWLQMRSFFWGGITGMVVAVALTALVAFTDAWGTIRAAFPSRR